MALLITDQCINCDMCLPECPNEAIYEGERCMKLMWRVAQNVLGFMTIKPAFQSAQLNVLFRILSMSKPKSSYRKSLIS